ncbi:MAG TPA: CDP-diacylglycerol--serine O-phosphatidyltransferase [Gemmataceae bacterium]|jgi:CDP-diacylglycerol--serine O-phosphatidyltransferase
MAVRKIVIVPTLLTLGNAVCGLASIAYASRIGKEGFSTDLATTYLALSGWLILAAMVFDALDGSAARLFKSTGEFGAELDSLCDTVSFGVAPAFLLLQLGPGWDQPVWHRLLAAVATLYLMCTVLRLARFNVEARAGIGSGKRFRGLPSPAAAGCVAALAVLRATYTSEAVHFAFEAWATAGAFLVALLMVSQVSYPHLTKQMLRGGRTAVPLLLTAVVLLVLAREAAVALMFWGYALLGLARHVAGKLARREKSLRGERG